MEATGGDLDGATRGVNIYVVPLYRRVAVVLVSIAQHSETTA